MIKHPQLHDGQLITRIQKIIKKAGGYCSVAYAAEQLGVPRATFSAALLRRGIYWETLVDKKQFKAFYAGVTRLDNTRCKKAAEKRYGCSFKELIKHFHDEGMPIKEAAQKIGMDVTNLSCISRRYGYPLYVKGSDYQPPFVLSDDQRALIYKRHAQAKRPTIKALAAELGLTFTQTSRQLYKLGLVWTTRKVTKPKIDYQAIAVNMQRIESQNETDHDQFRAETWSHKRQKRLQQLRA